MIDLDYQTFITEEKKLLDQDQLYRLEKVLAIFKNGKDLSLNIETGPWLAGGSLYRLFTGSGGDFDIFFANEKQFSDFRYSIMIENRLSNRFITERKHVIDIEINIGDIRARLQLVKRLFDSVDILLNEFDFTLCQLATDGDTLVVGDNTIDHLKARVCVPNHIYDPRMAIRRLLKFSKMGCNITDEAISAIIDCRNDQEFYTPFEDKIAAKTAVDPSSSYRNFFMASGILTNHFYQNYNNISANKVMFDISEPF